MAIQPAATLSEVRVQISDVQHAISATEAAPLPLDFIEDAMRRSFADLVAPKNDVLARLAAVFSESTDRVLSPIPGAHTPEAIGKLALALVIAESGGKLIADARQQAEIDDLTTGKVRIDPAQRAARNAELRADLYTLELAEEAVVTATAGTDRRPDANAGAVLGIPTEIAALHRYFAEV